MGGSHSKSVVSHFSHPMSEPGHRFKRPEPNNHDQVHCRMCEQLIDRGAAAYRCTRCSSFSIHDACFHRPQTIASHPAHTSHQLTLSREHHTVAAGGVSCTICAVAFPDPPTAFVYGCGRRTDCHGFYAHPSCCDLPHKLTTGLHQHDLTLLSPPPRSGDRHRRSSSCLNPKCRNSRPTEAWSYQCLPCNRHLCLACREGGEPGGRRRRECVIYIFGCMGEAMGTFGRRLGFACIGIPASA